MKPPHVHKLGIYDRENVSSKKVLLTDKKICLKRLFGTRCEIFAQILVTTGIQIGAGDWLENVQKLVSGRYGS